MQSLVAVYIIVPLLLILFALWAFMLITTTTPRNNNSHVYELPVHNPHHVNYPVSGPALYFPRRAPRSTMRDLQAGIPQRPPFAHVNR
ncbi:hypothetical protein BJ165DRAFT_1527390 [Panaeolus papilionaceus]|nr:hypothetical protein BJ165DRAFT_1527390 [Panaeolus papilionaceus]